MDKKVSVIICTHNPRENYLTRVLSALRLQTLPKDDWELLLIDNASAKPLATSWDLSWHPNGRHVREEKLGLTQARLRGIRESVGELIIFVDDDNVLSSVYLTEAIKILGLHPHVGAFGGSSKGELEVPPPAWMEAYLPHLAVSELNRDYWSNLRAWSEALPVGAGLCVRRAVAEDYEQKSRENPLRATLDRTGAALGGCGDIDLAWCAIDIGMGTGRFQALELVHLIPAGRLTEEYFVKLAAGNAASLEILESLRTRIRKRAKYELFWSLLEILRSSGAERRMLIAGRRARTRARDFLSGRRASLQF